MSDKRLYRAARKAVRLYRGSLLNMTAFTEAMDGA